MDTDIPSYQLAQEGTDTATLHFSGNWTLHSEAPGFSELADQLSRGKPTKLSCDISELGDWDSALPAFLLQCQQFCETAQIDFDTEKLPEGARRLLKVATAVATHQRPEEAPRTLMQQIDPVARIEALSEGVEEHLAFVGEVVVASGRLLAGKANTRRVDFLNFLFQAGPDAFKIISLTSFLVGMILAYLGAAQLAQFGAQVYVANLVTVGMLREMGALMTAVVMAGRTGAAFAAQLGTMQTREEIDAIVTLGISPVEFLVLPRMIALVVIMPLLVLYADVIGIFGGAIVAAGMDVSLVQFGQQLKEALEFNHLWTGLLKSVVFAVLIALAGCRAGMQCGRSSAAVGDATTNAVVTSIVYIIVADAAFNILFQKLGV